MSVIDEALTYASVQLLEEDQQLLNSAVICAFFMVKSAIDLLSHGENLGPSFFLWYLKEVLATMGQT